MITHGADKLSARFRAIGQTEAVVRDIVIHGVRESKLIVHRRTGNLGRTIRIGHITPTTGELLAGGRLKVGYAGAVERGSRPHTIRPRNRRALAWGGPRTLGGRLRVSGGVTARPAHFAKVVHHPGSRAYPYLIPGLRKAARERGVSAIVELWNAAA